MSVCVTVYLRRSAMPALAQWQRAIHDAGFPVELDADFDVETSRGFRPCRFRGVETGFEYLPSEVDESEWAELEVPEGTDFVVTLISFASDVLEYPCSLVAAGALCRASGGLLVDSWSGESCSSERALAWVAQRLSDLEPRLG